MQSIFIPYGRFTPVDSGLPPVELHACTVCGAIVFDTAVHATLPGHSL